MGDKIATPALPLSRSDRQRIISELEALPQEVRGNRVDTLVSWVETALTISFNDIFEQQDGHTPALKRVRAGIKQLVAGASAVAPFLRPNTASDLRDREKRQPGWTEFDVMQAVLYHLGLSPSEKVAEDSRDRISRSVRLLEGLPPILEAPAGDLELSKGAPIAWMIRAVMYYRYKENLKLTITWNRTSDAPKYSHREDRHMSAWSDTAKLVEATARLFGFETPNRTLSDQMIEYRRLYKARSAGVPEYDDFASPLRYFVRH